MDKDISKRVIKNVSTLALIIALSGTITYGMISLVTPINSKLLPKSKKTLSFINKEQYSVSDLVVYKNGDGFEEILLGNIPGTKQLYDITDQKFYRVLKTSQTNGRFLNTIYTSEISSLVYDSGLENYKGQYTKEEIIQLESELNSKNLVRKIN